MILPETGFISHANLHSTTCLEYDLVPWALAKMCEPPGMIHLTKCLVSQILSISNYEIFGYF
jgi:hypothetical protein